MSLLKKISKFSFSKNEKVIDTTSELKLGSKKSKIISELESLRNINTFI